MEKLLEIIAKSLVKNPDAVSVYADEVNDDGIIVYHLKVDDEDMGRVIGKQGKISKSIRSIMRATAIKDGVKIHVQIG